MKINLQKLAVFLVFFAVSSLTHAANRDSITLKAGSFTLANENQTVKGVPVTFDTTSSSVFSIEYEKKIRRYLTWGVEFIGYQNLYTPGTTSSADSLHIMANIKKYFHVSRHAQAFVGVGAGASTVTLDGAVDGSAGGTGFQAMAGFKFPFKSFSLILEYKMISAKSDDSAGESVDISGDGAFAGIGITF